MGTLRSESFGMQLLYNGIINVTANSRKYPHITRMPLKWTNNKMQLSGGDRFPCTSICLHYDYAPKPHRDKNNLGPSAIVALGDFTGGELLVWEEDDPKASMDDLDPRQAKEVNIRNNLYCFDGNMAHAVKSFEGERYSVVFYTG